VNRSRKPVRGVTWANHRKIVNMGRIAP